VVISEVKEIKKLLDSKLNPVNRLCRLLQMFLRSHTGFIREDLQGYLNMFFIIMNPPENKYEKIEKILELEFHKSVYCATGDKNAEICTDSKGSTTRMQIRF
jgi:hypothetical protein